MVTPGVLYKFFSSDTQSLTYTGNILYLYLICLNFTTMRRHHFTTRPSSIIRKINPQTSTTKANPDNTYVQRFHNHLVKMMNVNHGDKVVGIYSDPIYYHWSRDEMLTPWNNNRFHLINHGIIDKSYEASDEYVEWFCKKLQGKKVFFLFSCCY